MQWFKLGKNHYKYKSIQKNMNKKKCVLYSYIYFLPKFNFLKITLTEKAFQFLNVKYGALKMYLSEGRNSNGHGDVAFSPSNTTL